MFSRFETNVISSSWLRANYPSFTNLCYRIFVNVTSSLAQWPPGNKTNPLLNVSPDLVVMLILVGIPFGYKSSYSFPPWWNSIFFIKFLVTGLKRAAYEYSFGKSIKCFHRSSIEVSFEMFLCFSKAFLITDETMYAILWSALCLVNGFFFAGSPMIP